MQYLLKLTTSIIEIAHYSIIVRDKIPFSLATIPAVDLSGDWVPLEVLCLFFFPSSMKNTNIEVDAPTPKTIMMIPSWWRPRG